jgi:hypothetical protein
MIDARDTLRLVRVILVCPTGDFEVHAIDPRGEDVQELIGATVMALPFDLAGRLVLYVPEGGTHEVNVRACNAFGGALSGSVVLAGLHASNGLGDLSDHDLEVWCKRLESAPG